MIKFIVQLLSSFLGGQLKIMADIQNIQTFWTLFPALVYAVFYLAMLPFVGIILLFMIAMLPFLIFRKRHVLWSIVTSQNLTPPRRL